MKGNSEQASYWKQAFELCELPYPQTNQKYKRIDVYWYEISKLKNGLGGEKYPQLFILMKSVLSLSHGNVAPEIGFSINKAILDVHGSSLKEKTIKALRLVKDYLVKSKECLNVTITKQMISSVKSAYAKYKLDLEAEKEMERKQREAQIKEKEKAAQHVTDNANKKKLEEIAQERKFKRKSINIAETTIEEGNKELQQCLLKKNLSKDALQRAHSKIEMRIKRKKETETEIPTLLAKKAKLAKK